jgi:(p)ppGpp synthase/HD superfamily hydrolase
LPYSFHLNAVAAQAKLFKHHIPDFDPINTAIWTAIYGHDSIEDARLTYNDIKAKYGKEAAEMIYLCTELRGRNRSARKGDDMLIELSLNKEAVFVKLCDIIANIKYSLLTNSTMIDIYREEYYSKIKPILYKESYLDMFNYIEQLLSITPKK